MKKLIYDESGRHLLRTIEAVPECGNYCEECGACLCCDVEDPCAYGGTEHRWVQYGDDEPEFVTCEECGALLPDVSDNQ